MRQSRFLPSVFLLGVLAGAANALPGYSKAFRTPCSTCHSVPPRLNATGKAFAEIGPAALGEPVAGNKIPVSTWISGLQQNIPINPGSFRATLNRVEAIWFGPISDDTRLFVEWRVVSKEFTSSGAVRDRSGRFEDLYLTHRLRGLDLTLGQARALAQLDASQRLTLSEPLALSRSLPGSPTEDARVQALRGFSLSGRSPLVRVASMAPSSGGSWTGSLAAAFPGEISIPITDEAKRTASNEFEFDVKGFLGEIFRRDGAVTYGLFGFSGRNDRSLYGGTASGPMGRIWLEGAVSRGEVRGSDQWIGSLDLSHGAGRIGFVGFRIDGREAGDPIWIPYLAGYRQDTGGAWKYTFEARAQRDRKPIFLLEIGRLF